MGPIIQMTDTHHTLPLEKGGQIRLIRLGGSRTLAPPVILAHGTLSNAGTVWAFGKALAAEGHDVWLLEWGGHGSSTAPKSRRNFEAPAVEDLPRALAFVLEKTKAGTVFWVGHSGGGLLPLMYLARNPECQSLFGGLVTLGAQTTGAAETRAHKLRALGLYGLTQILGRTPRVQSSMGDEGEPTTLLAQWAVWNLKKQWTGWDGMDYMEGLSRITIPCMILAGARDEIAPAAGCKTVFDQLGSPDKTWVNCGTADGFSRDFSHGGLVRGTPAREEIFPKIGAWLRERSDPVDAGSRKP
jgi:pimeloyl-ACP methyl ester carboxylesterase